MEAARTACLTLEAKEKAEASKPHLKAHAKTIAKLKTLGDSKLALQKQITALQIEERQLVEQLNCCGLFQSTEAPGTWVYCEFVPSDQLNKLREEFGLINREHSRGTIRDGKFNSIMAAITLMDAPKVVELLLDIGIDLEAAITGVKS